MTYKVDSYIVDVLMRDLVGHDRKPASFLIYLWLATTAAQSGGEIEVSYQQIAENIGISKSAAQVSVGWLIRRKLLEVSRETATATPSYRVMRPWAQR